MARDTPPDQVVAPWGRILTQTLRLAVYCRDDAPQQVACSPQDRLWQKPGLTLSHTKDQKEGGGPWGREGLQ